MDSSPLPAGSHLFLVRLWPAEEDSRPGWRGKVQHLASGEARYFRDWPGLIDLLLAILPDLTPDLLPALPPAARVGPERPPPPDAEDGAAVPG